MWYCHSLKPTGGKKKKKISACSGPAHSPAVQVGRVGPSQEPQDCWAVSISANGKAPTPDSGSPGCQSRLHYLPCVLPSLCAPVSSAENMGQMLPPQGRGENQTGHPVAGKHWAPVSPQNVGALLGAPRPGPCGVTARQDPGSRIPGTLGLLYFLIWVTPQS